MDFPHFFLLFFDISNSRSFDFILIEGQELAHLAYFFDRPENVLFFSRFSIFLGIFSIFLVHWLESLRYRKLVHFDRFNLLNAKFQSRFN